MANVNRAKCSIEHANATTELYSSATQYTYLSLLYNHFEQNEKRKKQQQQQQTIHQYMLVI